MVAMWRTLIADDEPIIREGILKTIDWKALNIEVVAEAEDGEEALDYVSSHQIHIALVDLNMPILNGLSFIRKLKEILPMCRVIIISGFDKFDYAQEAIRLEVDDYLLKPINAELLHSSLERVTQDLEQKSSHQKHFTAAYQQIAKNLNLLRERFCLDWISGNFSESEVYDQLGFLQLPQTYPSMVGVVRWFEKDASKPYVNEKDRQLYLFAIENIVREWLQPWPHFICRNHQGLILVIVWDTLSDDTIQLIRKSIAQFLEINAFLCFELVDAISENLHIAYQRACEQVYNQSQLSPIVRRAQHYMNEHYTNPLLNLNGVAGELQISPTYLSRQLKEELGYSFIYVLTSIRISKALSLLDSTTLSINEIAHLTGYDNQHYFSTSFKKNVGLSPIQYRQSQQ